MFEASYESSVVYEWHHISGDIAQYQMYTVCAYARTCVCVCVCTRLTTKIVFMYT